LPGGFLGVSLFFTLSGYLIVDLLLVEGERTGRIDLRAFWSRRLRRLAPASLMVIVAVVGLATWLSTGVEADRVRGDAVSSVAYVANWRFILEGQSYDQLFAAPSPLQHLWSLAIEEQMYLFVPVLVALVFACGGGRRVVAVILALASVASVLASVVTTRHDVVYYGSHTRAAELLIGALLACVLGRRWDGSSRVFARSWSVAGALSVFVIVALARVSDVGSVWVYSGSLAAFALLSAVAVLGSIVPGPTARVLGWRPLTEVGKVSYGLYLVHWPVIVWMNEDRLGFGGVALFAMQMAVTAAIAVVSHRFIEMPVRERRLLRGPSTAGATLIVSIVVTVALAVTFLPSVDATPDSGVEVLSTVPRSTTSVPNTGVEPVDDVFDGSGPMSVLVVGDSTAENIARALADVGDPDVGVVSGGVLGCPLLPASRVRDRVVGEQDVTYCPDVVRLVADNAANVDVVLVVVGIANQWDYLPPGESNWVDAGSSEHRRALDVLMERIQDVTAPLGVTTLVLEAPAVRDNPDLLGDDPEAIAKWSEVMRDWDQRWASVRVVPYADLLSDPYGDAGRAERPDGVHLDRAFAADLARDPLLPRIRLAWVSALNDVASG
jgi:peptidoglycan/LPS O-acetylase OafA/YrhL